MSEAQFLGSLIPALSVLGGFIAVIIKINQPINDLRVVVQELKDCIAALKCDNSTQNRRLDAHGKEIDKLKLDVQDIKTTIEVYRRDKNV